MVTWDDLVSRRYSGTVFGDRIIIRLDAELLKNPSAVVGKLAHELHEIRQIRQLFAESGGVLTKGDLYDALWSSNSAWDGGVFHLQALQFEINAAERVGIRIQIFDF